MLFPILAVATLGLAAVNDSDDGDDGDEDLLDLLGVGLTVTFATIPPSKVYPERTFRIVIYEGQDLIVDYPFVDLATVSYAVATALSRVRGADGGSLGATGARPSARSANWQDIFNAVAKQMEAEGYDARDLFQPTIDLFSENNMDGSAAFWKHALENYLRTKK